MGCLLIITRIARYDQQDLQSRIDPIIYRIGRNLDLTWKYNPFTLLFLGCSFRKKQHWVWWRPATPNHPYHICLINKRLKCHLIYQTFKLFLSTQVFMLHKQFREYGEWRELGETRISIICLYELVWVFSCNLISEGLRVTSGFISIAHLRLLHRSITLQHYREANDSKLLSLLLPRLKS